MKTAMKTDRSRLNFIFYLRISFIFMLTTLCDVHVEAMLLREDLADLMPMVNEANAISQELDKKVTFCLLHFCNKQGDL